ncbi:Endoribonuclease YbeY [Buchnera aphidicola (Eriosoma lanigerum)]|uniref:rRNA maturation RNase YbeY n=1 Tax=Buchnera aphidicola TaxID=9 RepID=UPI00346450BC
MNKLKLNLQLACTNSSYIPKKIYIKRWLSIILYNLKIKTEITVRIVNKTEIKFLNYTYRNKNKVTNILSFPYQILNFMHTYLIGELVLCSQKIQEESIKQKKNINAHWAHMIIHGTLHLIGHDHINKTDQMNMESLEINYLKNLGFSNPYIKY